MLKLKIQPINDYHVSIENKYVEEIITSSGIKLFTDVSYNPTQHTTVIGTIASLPKNNSLNLKVGEQIFFSYVVIGERNYAATGHIFHPLMEKQPDIFQKYANGKGEKLTIVSMPGVIGHIWVGTHLTDRNELISGCQGSESEVNRWKSQFSFQSDAFKYKNLIPNGNEELWIIKPELIFARKRGKKLEPLGDRLILSPIQIPVPKDAQTEMGIKIPSSSLYAQYFDRAELNHYDKETKLSKGDVVAFQPNFVEQYTVDGIPYYLLRRRRILGTYSKFQLNFKNG